MTDVDRALDDAESYIRRAVEDLTLAGNHLRLAASGLPAHPLTTEQTVRRTFLLGAVAASRRMLADALEGRMEIKAAADEVAGDGR